MYGKLEAVSEVNVQKKRIVDEMYL